MTAERQQVPYEPLENVVDDTATRSLSREERERLSMDSWEPSLLRKLLTAQNRLNRRRTGS